MNPQNLHIRYLYQIHLREAKGASEKTIDEVVAAIAEFEVFIRHRGFDRLQKRHSQAFKQHLMERSSKADDRPLAKSTILHRLGHLREFLGWLETRPGYRKLDPDIAAFLAPPRRDEMAARTLAPRQGLTMPDLVRVIEGMPQQTLADRRNQAALALIVLTGVRDAALVSLRRKHLDLVQGRLNQDASEVDTKFGKNLWTHFFPVPPPIRDVVTGWAEELDALGYSSEAPFLPRDVSPAGLREPSPWKTAGPVRAIMKRACANAGIAYRPPHTIRHTLAVYGDEVCRTLLDKKAWSQNLGHSAMTTTELSYGTLSDDAVGSRIGSLSKRAPIDDVVAMLDAAGPDHLELVRMLLNQLLGRQ
jgi:integrase